MNKAKLKFDASMIFTRAMVEKSVGFNVLTKLYIESKLKGRREVRSEKEFL